MPDKRKKEPRNDLGTDDCLFDKEGLINKREFLKRLGKIGGLTLTSFAFVGIPQNRAWADNCKKAVYPNQPESGDECPLKYGDGTLGPEVGDECEPPFTGLQNGSVFNAGDECRITPYPPPTSDHDGDICVYPFHQDEKGGDVCCPAPVDGFTGDIPDK